MKAALRGNLVAGIQTCGEVFFCVADAYVAEGREDGVTRFLFKYAVEVVKITVKHFLKLCAVNVLVIVGREIVTEGYDVSASTGTGGDGVDEAASVVLREHADKLTQQAAHKV